MLTVNETCLRPYEAGDLETLKTLRNDAAMQASLLALPRGSSSERVVAWVTQMSTDSGSLFFVVATVPTGRPIGFVQLARIDFIHGHGELGIALTAEARGKGHGAAAIQLLEGHARDVFGIRKCVLHVLATNEAAMRLYERLGYVHVGTLRSHFYHRGAHHDVVLMEKSLVDTTRAR